MTAGDGSASVVIPESVPGEPDSGLPSVSVVIPARECAAHIGGCLEAVAAQTYPGRLDVTVALAPSADGTRQAVSETAAELGPQPSVRVVDNPAVTTPAGLNTAAAASTGDVLVRVDAQSRIPPGYIERAVRTMRRTGAANVGGVQRPVAPTGSDRRPGAPVGGGSRRPPSGAEATGTAAAIAAALASPFGGGPAAYRLGRREGPADTVYLGVFDRRAFDDVGGFDESMERNQDYELNWRLRRAGYSVWLDPALVVDYTPRGTYSDLAVQHFRYGAWKRTMLIRHPRALRPRQVAPPALLTALVASAVELARGRLRGALVPLLYAAACACAAARLRVALPSWSDRSKAGFACAVIHLSWACGFFAGRPRSRARRIGSGYERDCGSSRGFKDDAASERVHAGAVNSAGRPSRRTRPRRASPRRVANLCRAMPPGRTTA